MVLWSLGLFISFHLVTGAYQPDRFSPHESRLLPGPIERFKNELLVDPIVKESSLFKIKAHNVTRWLRLKLDNLYLLGVGHKEISLVTMYRIKSNKYQFHEYPVVTPYKVTCATMFKSHRTSDETDEGVVLLGLDSPQPSVAVYHIHHFKLYHITDWKVEGTVQAVTHFRWHVNDRVMIFQKLKNVTQATIYGFELEASLPHIWHLETLPLDLLAGLPSLGRVNDDTLFLATVDKKFGNLNVYSYKRVCPGLSGNKFELALKIPELDAQRVEFFQAYGRPYLLIVGKQTVLFRITEEGFLVRDTVFAYIEEMMVVPIVTTREDTILLGKSRDGNPHLYTFVDNVWEEKLVPKCQRSSNFNNEVVNLNECIGGSRSWSGATFIDTYSTTGADPALVFADRRFPGELYHMSFALQMVAVVHQSVNYDLLDRLETYWNHLRSSLLGSDERGRMSSVTSIPPLCAAKSDIEEMLALLSETKGHVNAMDCSSLAPVWQLGENHVVHDEKKPDEFITFSSNSVDTVESPTSPSVLNEAPLYVAPPNKYGTPSFTPELGGKQSERQALDQLGVNDDVFMT